MGIPFIPPGMNIHQVISFFKRWLYTSVEHPTLHLDYYLDESTFRVNRRNSMARRLLLHLGGINGIPIMD